ncbi:catechol 2,3-dioxygenase-like lactoylglutathione lyase family enzyme [Mycobacteroides chelonae]|nr:catechol 2,3-dioxygenase-like lactoylglutathione lyase family enzyme [Mycobacteroides chelonae]
MINCAHVETTAAWYERMLGMARETFGPADRTALMFGSQKINLRPITATQDAWFTGVAAAAGSNDLCFVTDASPTEVREHLAACEVDIAQGPVTKIGALGEMTSHYCRDLDGNLIAIAVYP